MIGGWLSPAIRNLLQDEICGLQQLVTIGDYTLEQANHALRHIIEITEAVKAGELTEEEGLELTERFAFGMRDKVEPS